MTSMRVSLQAGEKIYINGAVLRVDRKTSFEIMNDAVFLLDKHVLQAEDATTPLRQLYFIAQTILMDPANAKSCRLVFDESFRLLHDTVENAEILAGLEVVGDLMEADRTLAAMKAIRALTTVEDRILADPSPTSEAA